MHALTNTTARIEALIGRDDLDGLAWDLAARAADAILEDGTEHHTGWTAVDAIEAAAQHVEGIDDLTENEEAEVVEALEAAIKLLGELAAAPLGIVLVNADDGHVHAQGIDLSAAQSEIDGLNGATQIWEQVNESDFFGPHTVGAGRYRAYELALLKWSAKDADTVRGLGTPAGLWLARNVSDLDEAA